MLGTNDCKSYYHALSREVIGFGVEKLIGQIRQAGEHIKILLVSPILLHEKVRGNRNMIQSLTNSQWRHHRQLKNSCYRELQKSMDYFLAASDVAETKQQGQRGYGGKPSQSLCRNSL